MSQLEIQQKLELHELWVNTNGTEGRRANLSHADLSGMDLSGMDLSDAILSYANLEGCGRT